MTALSETLRCSRFVGDTNLLESLRADDDISRRLNDAAAVHHQNSIRTQLLAHAVRVDLHLIPRVARSLDQLRGRTNIDTPMEAYVFEDSSINGFVTRGHSHTFVVLSSGAVNNLSAPELEFVIGHELGHTIFGHLDVAAPFILQNGGLDPRSCMRILAWQRASEISADRAGLICCGSIDVAATALFKTLSGLNIEGLRIDPAEFAGQWEHLAREVIEGGESDHWQISHPFPPLRMKAMMVFWESGFFDRGESDEDATWPSQKTDDRVLRLLAMMDPLARESKDSTDPILADFFLWGGLYLALANGELHESELERLAMITSRSQVKEVMRHGAPDSAHCLERFGECIGNRRQKLKALETHRIIQGLLEIAIADGSIDEQETDGLVCLAGKLGIRPNACSLMISQFQAER